MSRPYFDRQAGILALLELSPRTTAEVATAMGIKPVNAGVLLRTYELRGYVAGTPVVPGRAMGMGAMKRWARADVQPPVRVRGGKPKRPPAAPKAPPKPKPAKVQRAPAVRVAKPAPVPRTTQAQLVNDQAFVIAQDKAVPVVKAGAAETIGQWEKRTGQKVEVLPPTRYVAAAQQPVGWKT